METKDRGIFVLRAVVGFGFLFAGLDKFFMWASGTPFTAAGFLKFATMWTGVSGSAVLSPATPVSCLSSTRSSSSVSAPSASP